MLNLKYLLGSSHFSSFTIFSFSHNALQSHDQLIIHTLESRGFNKSNETFMALVMSHGTTQGNELDDTESDELESSC